MKELFYTDNLGKRLMEKGMRFYAWKHGNSEDGDLPFLVDKEEIEEGLSIYPVETVEFIHSASEPVAGFKGKADVISVKELFEKFNKSRLTRD